MNDQPGANKLPGQIQYYKCSHTCACLGILTSDKRAVFSVWETCKFHLGNEVSHPACSETCQGSRLLHEEHNLLSLKPSEFRTERPYRTETIIKNASDNRLDISEIKLEAPVVQALTSLDLAESTPFVETTLPNLSNEITVGGKSHPVDDSDDEIEIIHVKIRCVHSCRCFGRATADHEQVPFDTFSSITAAQEHISALKKHPRCGVSCPGYQKLDKNTQAAAMSGNIRIKQEASVIDLCSDTTEVFDLESQSWHGGGGTEKGGDGRGPRYEDLDDDDDSVVQVPACCDQPARQVYICSHICACLGASCIYDIDKRTFDTRRGAARHVSCISKHPHCKPSCPAFKALGPNIRNAPVTVKSISCGCSTRAQPSSNLNHTDSRRDKGSLASLGQDFRTRSSPRITSSRPQNHSRFTTSHGTSKASTQFRDAAPSVQRPLAGQKRGASQLEEMCSPTVTPPPPTPFTKRCRVDSRNANIPFSSFSSSTFCGERQGKNTSLPSASRPTRPHHLEAERVGCLILHVSTLNELRRRFCQISSNMDALSTSLIILSHAPSQDTPLTVPARDSSSPPILPVSAIPQALLSLLARAISTLQSSGKALGDILIEDGLSMRLDREIRALKYKVSGLHDKTIQLHLDLIKANGRNGANGMVGERDKADRIISEVLHELDGVRDKIKEVMFAALDK